MPKEIGRGVSIFNRGCLQVEDGCRIGSYSTITVEKGAALRIGSNVFIGQGCIIKCYGGEIVIGNDVSLNAYCFVNGAGGISIGEASRIGAHSIIIASNHTFSDTEQRIKDQGTVCLGVEVGMDNWFGARVTILDGVKTVDGCIFAAGAVVTRSVDTRGVYAGIPAVFKRQR